MEIALFSSTGLQFILRWFHFFFGIIWIGLLYYFNFVQGPFFSQTDGTTKSNMIQKMLPNALWWFRWGAMFTLITGILILMMRGHEAGADIYVSSWGVSILTGTLFGLFMWANVWFVIWPQQKIVIESATRVAQGGQALPDAAAAAARGLVASRTNVVFSIPLLFYMGAASHLPVTFNMESHLGLYSLLLLIIVGLLEANALKGKTGPMTTVKGVIHCGFALAIAVYALMEILL